MSRQLRKSLLDSSFAQAQAVFTVMPYSILHLELPVIKLNSGGRIKAGVTLMSLTDIYVGFDRLRIVSCNEVARDAVKRFRADCSSVMSKPVTR